MESWRAAGIAAVLGLSTIGCGVGGALAGAGGGGGGGGTAPREKPTPYSAPRLQPGQVVANRVPFCFLTRHVSGLPTLKADPQFEIGTPGFQSMTIVASPLDSAAACKGTDRLVVWQTYADIAPRDAPVRVNVRVDLDVEQGFQPRTVQVLVDNRLASTVATDGTRTRPRQTPLPVGLAVTATGVVIANANSDTIDRLDRATGRVERLVSRGVPVADDGLRTAAPRGDRAAVQLRSLLGVAVDAGDRILAACHFYLAATTSAPRLLEGIDCAAGDLSPYSCHRPEFHPSGAILYTTSVGAPQALATRIVALNPQVPGPTATSVGVGAFTIPPGECRTLHQSAFDQLTRVHGLALGLGGEIYFDEVDPGDKKTYVVAFNPADTERVVGTVSIPSGAVARIAGPYQPTPSQVTDLRPVEEWDRPVGETSIGREFVSLAIDHAAGVLYVAEPAPRRIHALDVLPARMGAPVTVHGTAVPAATGSSRGALIVGPPADANPSAAVGFDIGPAPINAIALDADGNLLFAQGSKVLLLRSDAGATAYGSEPRSDGRVLPAVVYDATRQIGILSAATGACAARDDGVVLFADDRTVRAFNPSSEDIDIGAATVESGFCPAVAGGAEPGFAGDGGPGISALLDHPAALAADLGDPNALFIADTGNHRVRLLNLASIKSGEVIRTFGVGAGAIETVVGGGPPVPGDGDGGAPLSASLSAPRGVAVRRADGVLFVADTGHHRVRAVNPLAQDVLVGSTLVPSETIVTVVGDGSDDPGAGDGPAPGRTSEPTFLAIDDEVLYFADRGNARIRAFNFSDHQVLVGTTAVAAGSIATICGDGTPAVRGDDGDRGPAAAARIGRLTGLCVVLDDNSPQRGAALYFSDGDLGVVRVINISLNSFDLDPHPDLPSVSLSAGAIATINGLPDSPGASAPAALGAAGVGASSVTLRSPSGIAVTRAPGQFSRVVPANVFVALPGPDAELRAADEPILVRFGAVRFPQR